MQPYRKVTVTSRENMKFPANIESHMRWKIYLVAYKITLSNTSRVHPIEHVLQIKLKSLRSFSCNSQREFKYGTSQETGWEKYSKESKGVAPKLNDGRVVVWMWLLRQTKKVRCTSSIFYNLYLISQYILFPHKINFWF